jgi:hypothetical protein
MFGMASVAGVSMPVILFVRMMVMQVGMIVTW